MFKLLRMRNKTRVTLKKVAGDLGFAPALEMSSPSPTPSESGFLRKQAGCGLTVLRSTDSSALLWEDPGVSSQLHGHVIC